MSKIQVKNLTFGYDGSYENIFENVSFNIDTDWKLGLIGKNGKGKTTFLKLLQNKYEYKGTIEKNIECDYFPFDIVDDTRITFDVIKSIVPNIEEWQIKKELNLINAKENILYLPFCKLSGGEKVKILLVILFLKDNKFLLLDEPTNHLDSESKKEVEKYLNSKKGFIVVSHDRKLLNSVVDHIISINNKGIDIQRGNYDSWKENKDMKDNFEIERNENLKKDIVRLTEAARQTSKWSNDVEKTKYGSKISGLRPDRGYIGHQAAKMMKRSKTIEKRINKQIEEKEELLENIDIASELTMKPLNFYKKELIIAKDLQINYDTKVLFNKLNFKIGVGDRVALIGKNGCGKTSLIKLILKENISYSGKINIANNIKISYVSQDTNELKGNLRDYAKSYKVDESIFRAMLNKLGVDIKDIYKDISSMSDGQKKKILIARSISESADLYIWDEPLNFIDIIAKEQIESMIIKYKPTMIFVEHDDTFCEKIATQKIELINIFQETI